MNDVLAKLPRAFFDVPYVASKIPDGENRLDQGANCQRYAYAMLQEFGITVPGWRSSELWEDKLFSTRVTSAFLPLDLLLFNKTMAPFGAHVGVYIGCRQVLHLCRAVGVPAVWQLEQFTEREQYVCLIGAKRFRT